MANSDKALDNRSSWYKMIFFDCRGRAEPARMMMSLAGQEFIDERLSLEEWQQNMKPKAELGFLPILETESGQLAPSMAMYNFLANKFGYHPVDLWDRSQSESMMITLNDLLEVVRKKVYYFIVYNYEPVPENIEQNMAETREEIRRCLEFAVSRAKTGTTFLFGNEMTVADFVLYNTIDFCAVKFPETRKLNDYIEKWLVNMEGDERFASYLKNRNPGTLGT